MPRRGACNEYPHHMLEIHILNDNKCQTVQIQISWLLQKPADLDLHCLLREGMSCSA